MKRFEEYWLILMIKLFQRDDEMLNNDLLTQKYCTQLSCVQLINLELFGKACVSLPFVVKIYWIHISVLYALHVQAKAHGVVFLIEIWTSHSKFF